LVSAITPAGIWSRRQIAKCSRVCGMTDSSAATTSSTASIPPTPASMFLMNRSWPGTSTNATLNPPISTCANPRSIVMPRAFSSFNRSGSVPVNARTSVLLP
jgi:hypothetical protein